MSRQPSGAAWSRAAAAAWLMLAGCGALRDRAPDAAVRAAAVAPLIAASDSAAFTGTVRVGLEDAPATRTLVVRHDGAGATLVSEEELRSGGLVTIVTLDPATLAPRTIASVRAADCGSDSARITLTPTRVTRDVNRCGTGRQFDGFMRPVPAPLVAREELPLWLRGWLPDRPPGHDLHITLVPAAFDPPPFAPTQARLRVVDGGRVTGPAGTFDTWKVAVADARGADVFWFERTTPHRLLLWETAGGERWRREPPASGAAR